MSGMLSRTRQDGCSEKLSQRRCRCTIGLKRAFCPKHHVHDLPSTNCDPRNQTRAMDSLARVDKQGPGSNTRAVSRTLVVLVVVSRDAVGDQSCVERICRYLQRSALWLLRKVLLVVSLRFSICFSSSILTCILSPIHVRRTDHFSCGILVLGFQWFLSGSLSL